MGPCRWSRRRPGGVTRNPRQDADANERPERSRVISTSVTRRRFIQGTNWPASAPSWPPAVPAVHPGHLWATSADDRAGTPRPTSAPLSRGDDAHRAAPFANWDAYIDVEEDGVTSPTLVDFTAEYGVEVDYANAEIEDNETFMATIRPQLQAGVATGWDIIVLTDWMAAKVVDAGWAEEIDPANIPTPSPTCVMS